MTRNFWPESESSLSRDLFEVSDLRPLVLWRTSSATLVSPWWRGWVGDSRCAIFIGYFAFDCAWAVAANSSADAKARVSLHAFTSDLLGVLSILRSVLGEGRDAAVLG